MVGLTYISLCRGYPLTECCRNVPNTSRSGLAKIEKQKSDLLDFYVAEVEQRKWYGFWDYGDVMHTYGKLAEQ